MMLFSSVGLGVQIVLWVLYYGEVLPIPWWLAWFPTLLTGAALFILGLVAISMYIANR